MANNVYASCVSVDGQGVLLIGGSGTGKSDLALRLIMDKKAVLVADDRVELSDYGFCAVAAERIA